MSNYLRELSSGEILRGTFEVYFKNFFKILVIYALPTFPLMYLQGIFLVENELLLYGISSIIGLLVISLAYAAITVALSDICLGNEAGIVRSYRFVFGKVLWKLLGTNLLQILIVFIGFILIIIPGVIFMFWFIFVPIIVVLENTWGRAALKRSKELGKGFYLRTFGLFVLLMLPIMILGGLIGGLSVVYSDFYMVHALQTAFSSLLQPLTLIMIILSYYDLRARKEAYDTTALSENLQR